MGDPKKILALSALILLMTACGGGDGNSERLPSSAHPALVHDEDLSETLLAIPEVASYQPIALQPRYEGTTERAELSRQNSFYFIEAVYQLLDVSYHAGTLRLHVDKSRVFRYDFSHNIGFYCTNGSGDYTEHESETGRIYVTTYNQCENSEYGKLHGQMISEVFVNSDGLPTHAIATYRDFTVEKAGERFTYQGRITTTRQTGMVVDHLTMHNSLLNATYHTEGLESTPDALEGRVYHSDWGYVDVRVDPDSPTDMHLEGEGASRLDLSHELIGRDSVLNLSLASASIEAQHAVSALETSVPFDEVLLWLYRANRAPEGELETVDPLEIGQTTTLDASGMVDQDHDFLTYSWRYLSTPDGCPDQAPLVGQTTEFPGNCRGLHELELTVGDGFHEIVLPFEVTVVGPLPQIEQSVAATPEEGSGALSFQIGLENESEAGPVQYEMAYGPSGIEVDPSGLVSGVPERLFQIQGGSIHIGVKASNERSVVQEVTVNYTGRDIEIAAVNRGGFPRDISRGWQDINGDGNREQLVDYGNTFAIIEVHQGATRYRHLETREFSTSSLQSKKVMDYNDDGQLDIVLLYSDKYVALSGSDFSVLDEQPLELNPNINRAAFLIPGVNPGVYYALDSADEEWVFREFKTGNQYPRVAPSLHGARTADFTGDGRHSLVTYVQSLGGDAIVNADGSVQRLDAYPSAIVDINGDGTDDIVHVSSQSSVDQFTMERYSATTGKLTDTYTVSVPELEGQYSFRTRFVNLDDDPGVELVMAASGSDQFYILKRNGTVFELTQKIPYPVRGNRTPMSIFGNLSQFDNSSAVVDGSVEEGQLFQFSLLSDPIEYSSGFHYYSRNLNTIQVNEESIDLLGVRRWLDEQGEARSELIWNTVNSNLDWVKHQRFPDDVPMPPRLLEVQTISSTDGATEHLLYLHSSYKYSVVDITTQEEVYTGSLRGFAHSTGDLDGDGRVEAYVANHDGLFRLDSDTYQFRLIDDEIGDRNYERMAPFVTTFGGQNRVLFIPWQFQHGHEPRVDIYQYQEGAVQPVGTLSFGPRSRYMGYAEQDVTGDGTPELIVWNTDEETSFWVIDSSLSVVAQLTMETRIEGVFHLPDHKSDTLVAFKRGQDTVSWRETRIIQIDLASAKITTRSPTLPGSLDKHGLICLGEDLANCPKMVVTNLGIFSLR